MGRAPARIAAAIHGCCKASRQPPAPATVTEAIRVPAVRQNLRRSIPAGTTTAMARGNSIRPVSTGAKPIAGTAAIRITNTPATA